MIETVAALALAAWVYLLFLHHRFWFAAPRLPREIPDLNSWPSVIAIVPARNEVATIAEVVDALMKQNYPGDFSVLVVDDASTDGTSEAVKTLCAQNAAKTVTKDVQNRAENALHRADVIGAPALKDGWTGKLSALNAGIERANSTANPPDFVWFTDADVVHPPGTLAKLAAKAVQDRRDLVSLMVRLRCESFWEKRLIPAFIYFFQMLYPFPAANDPRAKVAAAAGGCVLLRRDSLQNAGGLRSISGELIDDCALAKLIKGNGGRIWLGLAGESRSLRAAETLVPLWAMVRRTAYTQLRHSPIMVAGTVAALALIFLTPPILTLTYALHQSTFAATAGGAAWAAMACSYIPTLQDYGRSRWESLLLPISAALYAGMTVDSAVAHGRHRGGQWKGRHYGPSAAPQNLSESP